MRNIFIQAIIQHFILNVKKIFYIILQYYQFYEILTITARQRAIF